MEALQQLFLAPLNHLLRQNAWAGERLARHAGATVLLRTADRAVFSFAIEQNGGFRACEPASGPAVTIELPADFLVRLLTDRSGLLASAHLSGRAELAESLAFVLRNLRWDSEADLARVFGDIPARRLDQLARRSLAQTRDVAGRSISNLSEYLTDESGLVLHSSDFSSFIAARSALERDLAQLEQRLTTLST